VSSRSACLQVQSYADVGCFGLFSVQFFSWWRLQGFCNEWASPTRGATGSTRSSVRLQWTSYIVGASWCILVDHASRHAFFFLSLSASIHIENGLKTKRSLLDVRTATGPGEYIRDPGSPLLEALTTVHNEHSTAMKDCRFRPRLKSSAPCRSSSFWTSVAIQARPGPTDIVLATYDLIRIPAKITGIACCMVLTAKRTGGRSP
jgi:hypothetical protein